MIVETTRENVLRGQDEEGQILLQPMAKWGNSHYQCLAKMMHWNISSVKRLFALPGHTPPKSFSTKSELTICRYLGVKDWGKLQELLLERSIRMNSSDQPNNEELKKSITIMGEKITEISQEYQQLKKIINNK